MGGFLVNFFQFVSLLEFSLLLYFASGVIDGDVYKTYFLIFALLKHLPEQAMKWGFKNSPVLHGLNLRPVGAKDCNSLNKGGPVGPSRMRRRKPGWDDRIDGRPGMPSGHCTIMAMYLTLHASNMIRLSSEKIPLNARSFILLAIFILGNLLMGFARTYLRCHTPLQVLVGYALGFIIGIIAFRVSVTLSSRFPIFRNSLIRFYSSSPGSAPADLEPPDTRVLG